QEFVAAAKAQPGKLRVGTPGEGTSSHLNLEELKRLTDTNLVHVPFSGWAEGSPAQPGEVRPLVESKRMRVLGVFQPARNANFAYVPTWKEVGYPVHNGAWFLFVLPKGTPPDVVKYLHDSAKAAIDDAGFTAFAKGRVIDVDYRAGDKLRADLWQEYKAHTEILKRIGMLRK